MTDQEIRDAVASGDYATAADRFAAYARSLPVSESGLRELRALLEWTRTTVLCANAHAADRLQRMQAEVQALAAYHR